MTMTRTSRLFKFSMVAFVGIIILLISTKQRISQTVDINESDDRNNLDRLKQQLVEDNNENVNIYKSNEDRVDEGENGNKTAAKKDNEGYVEEDADDQMEYDNQVPFDDSMPGAYMKFLEPAPTNRSYCKYNYQFPYDLVYTSKNYLFPPEMGKKSDYRILYNVTEAYDVQNASQVTYATHMTANYAYFIPELLKQWDGLITIAAFVPDLDSAFFLEQINQFCYCEPEMYRVSIHIVTHKLLAFSKKDIYFDRPETCIPQDSSRIAIYKEYDDTVVYPINVVRNVARTTALTKYVLLSDIELMPSKGLASGFLNMLNTYNNTNAKEVFVVPIFEVEVGESIPDNKQELLKLLDEEKAVYFHGLVCKHCQKFPGIEDWLKSGASENIKPLKTVKRQSPYHRWEPIFIGTNAEPLYSEALSWEGLQDKMSQSLEMCLQDYNYTILDNAFLCHWPGMKTNKVVDEEWRAPYVEQNQLAYGEIIKNLSTTYRDIPGCNVNYSNAVLPTMKSTIVVKAEVVKAKTR